MAGTLQSLQIELARLRRLVSELRSLGHTGFASQLDESVASLESEVAELIGTQQQQQIQPKKN